MDDYTHEDALGYDADFSDAKQYCRHGTWIGSWWGPDYMCSKCEMGIERCHVCGKEGEAASSWRLAEEIAFDQRRWLLYSDDDKWRDYICYECLMKRERERITAGIFRLMCAEYAVHHMGWRW